nr:late transcription factor VLTF-2 [Wadden Sea poxvirus]
MAKRVSIPNITISEPKAVYKHVTNNEKLTCVLPKYFTSVADISLQTSTDNTCCWFCYQKLIFIPYYIETMRGGNVGNFCSKICRDSFASMIKSNVALREEPKITLLPLIFYDNPEEVINIINILRNKDGIYGGCFYKENNKSIQISLRSLV